jgi:hypothetical protein
MQGLVAAMRSLRSRLDRLELKHFPSEPGLWLAVIDEHGIILDGSRPGAERWIGRHWSAVRGGVAKLVNGIDPDVVTGFKKAPPEFSG